MASNETTEPSALTAALAALSPFTPRVGGTAMHAANRHVERWAPEATAGSVRPMRSLSFVDRLVAPWIETAQRSASMRLFNHYTTVGAGEREGAAVSWVFPRPWYQDELDWMAAARQVQLEASQQAAPSPTMFTTRGTFVPPQQPRPAIAAPPAALPSALYEYVAPSLSIAQPAPQAQIAGVGFGGSMAARADAYSTLVPLAAVQAAELMSRAVAPLVRTISSGGDVEQAPTVGRVSPALRTVLTAMLERASVQLTDTRVAQAAPELVTPPAPRPDQPIEQAPPETARSSAAVQLADQYAEQRVRIVELQRIARVSAERELTVRAQEAAAQQAVVVERAAAQRVEATRTSTQPEAPRAEQPAAPTSVEAEQLRLEERIAQRLAERAQESEQQTRTQQVSRTGRLHEQARADAAQHARTPIEPVTPAQPPVAPSAPTVRTAPPEVAAAIAALPAELQDLLAAQPQRGAAAIAEPGEALRAVELMARSSAANQTFETTRGPRLLMPAGLGGLVAAVERAQVIAERPAQTAQVFAPTAAQPLPPRIETTRIPSLSWLTGPVTGERVARPFAGPVAAPTTALGATAATAPAALGHVAWSDRWLARFAGATPQSLDILQAGAASSSDQRMQALAAAAPESVFVRPMFDVDTAPRQMLQVPAFEPTLSAATALRPTPQLRPTAPAIERFDDNAETPDAVFAQIAAAAAGTRSAPSAAAQTPAAPPVREVARMSAADAIAHAAPSAPGAGLSAQLSASPFAPSLRHVMAMPAAQTFDVRALFGAALSATYLSGLLAPASEQIVMSGLASPAWASFQTAGTQAAAFGAERAAPELDLAYVTPEADVPAAAREESAARQGVEPIAATAAATAMPIASAPLTTLRTALLSWSVDPSVPATLADAPYITTLPAGASPSAAARAMTQSMSMPMLGDSLPAREAGAAWTSPGMIGERAHDWSVAQQRSSSDLAFDFVPPELVLAARVYGLGPAEAAQAMRLAVAGPSQLASMASTVDRTFVQALAIATERRDAATARPAGAQTITTAYPISSAIPALPTSTAQPSMQAPVAPSVGAAPGQAQLSTTLPSQAFGVERRAPRGAFLWPSATVAALGLSAAAPDSQQSMSVAALELLAAQAVAEIGTFAALADHPSSRAATTADGTPIEGAAARAPGAPYVAGAAPTTSSFASSSTGTPSLVEPPEVDVLGAAAAIVPISRRARFDALYIALSQSPSGRGWSPAARAARALALAGRGEDVPASAYERAATAWDVLPVVYATDGMSIAEIEAATATGTLPNLARAAARARGLAAPDMPSVDGRAGMSGLTARAGEALGSYVAPSTGQLATEATRGPSSRESVRESIRELPVAQRAPSAAQEMVRTGAPSNRYGGGDHEIPAWFETAARKLFGAGAATSSEGGFSMSELTLVTAAPSTHIAASSKAAPAASVSPASASAAGPADKPAPIDIDKLANDVYRQILVMMDAARSRNGEPYL